MQQNVKETSSTRTPFAFSLLPNAIFNDISQFLGLLGVQQYMTHLLNKTADKLQISGERLIKFFCILQFGPSANEAFQLHCKRNKYKFRWLQSAHKGNDARKIPEKMVVVGMQLDESGKHFSVSRFELPSRIYHDVQGKGNVVIGHGK